MTISDNRRIKKTRNLLIKCEVSFLDIFKIKGFEFYKENKHLKLFSYRHYMVLCLLNIESDFRERFKEILIPDADFLGFYMKRGNSNHLKNKEEQASINFLLPLVYSDLYFSLMHTYYFNECSTEDAYSISRFFIFIVRYIEQNDIEFYDVDLLN